MDARAVCEAIVEMGATEFQEVLETAREVAAEAVRSGAENADWRGVRRHLAEAVRLLRARTGN